MNLINNDPELKRELYEKAKDLNLKAYDKYESGDYLEGIELAKSATGTATTTGPGEIQKTATNTITTKDAKKNSIETLLANKRKGRRSTNITSAIGLEDNYTLAKKKLLG